MANIVVALYRTSKDIMISNSMPPYYEGFLHGLKKNGNNVLTFIHDIYGTTWDNKEISDSILNKLRTFQPDVFLLFNYDFYDCSNYFDVPFIIYDVDSPNRYQNKTAIKENTERYKFAVIQQAGIELVQDFCNADKNNIKYIKPFTELHNHPEPISNNIAFCGSHWLWSGCTSIFDFMKMQPTAKERAMARQVLQHYKKAPFGDLDEIYESYGYAPDRRLKNSQYMLAGRLSGLKRADFLSYISDLGLEVRGEFWNHPSLNFFPELALCYNPQPTVTIFENELFYNSSKIGFNINHIQAKTGFSWRVCDILASNACLVSEYTPDLDKAFSKIGIPMYTTKEEAYQQCRQLLENNSQREEIVAASNELIDREYRFNNILADLEELCDMPLRSDFEGTIEFVNLNNVIKSWANTVNKKISFTNRVERKIWTLLGNDLKRKGVV